MLFCCTIMITCFNLCHLFQFKFSFQYDHLFVFLVSRTIMYSILNNVQLIYSQYPLVIIKSCRCFHWYLWNIFMYLLGTPLNLQQSSVVMTRRLHLYVYHHVHFAEHHHRSGLFHDHNQTLRGTIYCIIRYVALVEWL